MSQHLKIFTDTHWTLIGFALFFGLFVIFIITTFLKSQVVIFSHLEKLPFEDETKESAL